MIRNPILMRLLASVTLALLCLLAPATLVSAAPYRTNPLSGVNCSAAPDSAVCKTKVVTPLIGANGVISRITDLVALVAGAAAVIVIALAGFRYITSNGDAEQVGKSKRAILMAIVGLIVILMGRFIIGFLIGKV